MPKLTDVIENFDILGGGPGSGRHRMILSDSGYTRKPDVQNFEHYQQKVSSDEVHHIYVSKEAGNWSHRISDSKGNNESEVSSGTNTGTLAAHMRVATGHGHHFGVHAEKKS